MPPIPEWQAKLEEICLQAVSASMHTTISLLQDCGWEAAKIYDLYCRTAERKGVVGQPTWLTGVALELVRRGLWTREEARL